MLTDERLSDLEEHALAREDISVPDLYELFCTIRELKGEIKSIESRVIKWIPVTERLPEEGFTNENCFVDPDSNWKKAESHLKCVIQDYEEFTRVSDANVKSHLSDLNDMLARYDSGERNLDLYTKMICAT